MDATPISGDDWMTDEHRAAALAGWNANPIARAAGLTSDTALPAEVYKGAADAYERFMIGSTQHDRHAIRDAVAQQMWFRAVVHAATDPYRMTLQEIRALLLTALPDGHVAASIAELLGLTVEREHGTPVRVSEPRPPKET